MWKIGGKYFIRTVTMHVTGKLVEFDDHELKLETAAWVADTGRFAQAVATGEFNEVEPFRGTILVGRGAIIDAVEIPKLPTKQK